MDFLTKWNRNFGNNVSEPGNGLATTTIETLAVVVGKDDGSKGNESENINLQVEHLWIQASS